MLCFVLQRSIKPVIDEEEEEEKEEEEEEEEEEEIDLAMIQRALERYQNRLRSTEETGADDHVASGGEKLILEALKVRLWNSN